MMDLEEWFDECTNEYYNEYGSILWETDRADRAYEDVEVYSLYAPKVASFTCTCLQHCTTKIVNATTRNVTYEPVYFNTDVPCSFCQESFRCFHCKKQSLGYCCDQMVNQKCKGCGVGNVNLAGSNYCAYCLYATILEYRNAVSDSDSDDE